MVEAVQEAARAITLRDLVAEARRLLRSPWTITAELAGVVLVGVAASVVAQHPSAAERARRAVDSPLAAAAVRALGLDRIFTAGWFLAVVALAACSLAVVVVEQWRRAAREWRAPGESWFRAAPYRRELIRPARGDASRLVVTTHGRLGSLGSPLFHTGLLVVTLAGVLRMLCGADAARTAVEGETIPAAAAGAFELQDRGLVAAPVTLPAPLRVVEILPAWHARGDLRALSASVATDAGAPRALAVNAPLDLEGARLHLVQTFGPAVLLDLAAEGTGSAATALLAEDDGGDYSWTGPLPGGLELRLRAPLAREARPPAVLDVRVLRGGALVAAGRLRPGAVLPVPGGPSIGFRGARWWVRLLASRDPSVLPMYVGFVLCLAGIALMFTIVRADALVVVEPLGAEERVLVALRPRRLAPLFADRFERLVQRETRAA